MNRRSEDQKISLLVFCFNPVVAVDSRAENPVRKGLVTRFEDYPYAGSDVVTNEQLQQLWHQKQG
jgi:hypothetical protein